MSTLEMMTPYPCAPKQVTFDGQGFPVVAVLAAAPAESVQRPMLSKAAQVGYAFK